MSCGGNRFACGIRRFEKHKFEPNRPSNQELHNENENRLSELLRAREQQDQAFFPTQTSGSTNKTTVAATASTSVSMTTEQSTYTPWTYRDDQHGAPLGRR
jgi:hypothetical protein